MRASLFALALLPTAAMADGFAITDLTALAVDTTTLSPGEWVSRADPERLTLLCMGCDSEAMADIQLGRQDDGTEGRVRSGETTFAMLQDQCRANDPACTLDGLDVAPAVGWITGYAIGENAAHTIVVLRGGDLLTIRTLAADAATARQNADALVAGVVHQVVGD